MLRHLSSRYAFAKLQPERLRSDVEMLGYMTMPNRDLTPHGLVSVPVPAEEVDVPKKSPKGHCLLNFTARRSPQSLRTFDNCPSVFCL